MNYLFSEAKDKTFLIYSSIAGYLYILFILIIQEYKGLSIHDSLWINLSLYQIIFLSWFFLLDGPHLWNTLSLLRNHHHKAFKISFIFIPLFPLITWILLSSTSLKILWLSALFFYWLWSYFHILKQHEAFLGMYQRKQNQKHWQDKAFFHFIGYFPLLIFFIEGYQFEMLGLPRLLPKYPWLDLIMMSLYLSVFISYCGYLTLYKRWDLPQSKMLIWLCPLHGLALAHPGYVRFAMPIMTSGHNIQYHFWVWSFGQKYYSGSVFFRSVSLFLISGIVFTFIISAFQGLMPKDIYYESSKYQIIFDSFILGWTAQHYFLDGIIWKSKENEYLSDFLNSTKI